VKLRKVVAELKEIDKLFSLGDFANSYVFSLSPSKQNFLLDNCVNGELQ
jgi:hypothetical protein